MASQIVPFCTVERRACHNPSTEICTAPICVIPRFNRRSPTLAHATISKTVNRVLSLNLCSCTIALRSNRFRRRLEFRAPAPSSPGNRPRDVPTLRAPRAASGTLRLRGTDACARCYPRALRERCARPPASGNNTRHRNGSHPPSSPLSTSADTRYEEAGGRCDRRELRRAGNPAWPWIREVPCRAWHGQEKPGPFRNRVLLQTRWSSELSLWFHRADQ